MSTDKDEVMRDSLGEYQHRRWRGQEKHVRCISSSLPARVPTQPPVALAGSLRGQPSTPSNPKKRKSLSADPTFEDDGLPRNAMVSPGALFIHISDVLSGSLLSRTALFPGSPSPANPHLRSAPLLLLQGRINVHTLACPPAMRRDNYQLEDFIIHRDLGTGHVSVVYLVEDKLTGVVCALKAYRKKKLTPLNRRQVCREIAIHSGLQHENVIELYCAFEDEYCYYLVLEYAARGDLFSELKRRGGQLNEKIVVKFVLHPFLSVLAFLHSKGIVHRDIKPENVLLRCSHILLSDFGFAINVTKQRPVTRLGTLHFMAPELLLNDPGEDPWPPALAAAHFLNSIMCDPRRPAGASAPDPIPAGGICGLGCKSPFSSRVDAPPTVRSLIATRRSSWCAEGKGRAAGEEGVREGGGHLGCWCFGVRALHAARPLRRVTALPFGFFTWDSNRHPLPARQAPGLARPWLAA